MDTDADRLEMIQSLGGQEVSIGGETVWAIFDRDFIEAGLSESAVEESAPVLTCRTVDVDGVRKGAVVMLADGTTYTTRRIEPDGTGMTRIILAG